MATFTMFGDRCALQASSLFPDCVVWCSHEFIVWCNVNDSLSTFSYKYLSQFICLIPRLFDLDWNKYPDWYDDCGMMTAGMMIVQWLIDWLNPLNEKYWFGQRPLTFALPWGGPVLSLKTFYHYWPKALEFVSICFLVMFLRPWGNRADFSNCFPA